MKRTSLWASIATVVLLVGSQSLALARPGQIDPTTHEPSTPISGTPAADDSPMKLRLIKGCGGVEDYRRELFEAIEDSGEFGTFISDGARADEIEDVAVAEQIVEDGLALEKSLLKMKVPEDYAAGHEGIILFMRMLREQVAFYAIDSSSSLDWALRENALRKIYQGETAIVKACPEEFESGNPYIFFDPAELEDEYGDD